jgi:D-3-phosphoglycerate dehydrogenase
MLGLIDTVAILAALDNGHISAAGFDVYECEPDLPDGFADRWDITVLPHIGYATAEALTEAENGVMRNIEDVLDGGCGIAPINKIE